MSASNIIMARSDLYQDFNMWESGHHSHQTQNPTRLHSSRMHTARALTVSPMLCGWGVVSARGWGVGVCFQGVSASGGCLLLGGCLLPGGVCFQGCLSASGGVCFQGCVSASGGVCFQGGLLLAVSASRGVSALGGVCFQGWGSVCLWGGCLLWRGVCSGGCVCIWGVSASGGHPSMH